MHIQDDDTGEKRAGPATTPEPVVDYVALAPGRVVGRYEVLEVLGQGGFGITYRVRDTQLDREVALKEYLPPALAIRQDGASVLPRSTEVAEDFSWGRERFVAEGRTLAGLHDAPAIVKVFDFIEANGTSYMVMELVRGGTLEDRVKRRGPLQPHEIDTFLPVLLEGLQQVHAAGFLHRDIKPGNILLSEAGVPTLIDFGAARLAIAGRSSTMTAIFTPGFAAPEQFTTGKQGPWTDIYGLAATLHHAITGTAPPSAFDRLLEDTYQPLAGLALIGYAPQLLAGIDAGLAVRFDERPPSIAAWRALLGGPMADADKTVLMPQPVVPPTPPSPPTPPTPPSPPTALAVAPRRSRRPAAIAAGLIALLGVAGGYYLLARAPQPSPPVETVAAAPVATPATVPETDPADMAREGEDALQLIPADRQRIQAVLTSLGYDTRGADGTFGQRSREMIAAWQKAKGQPATGYLTAAQVPALFREAPNPAAPATRAGVTAAPQTSPAAPRGAATYDGVYGGGLSTSGMADAPGVVTAELSISGDRLIGRVVHPGCGASSITLSVAASGEISGSGRVFESQDCSMAPFTATGRAAGNSVTLEMRTTAGAMRGSLTRRGG